MIQFATGARQPYLKRHWQLISGLASKVPKGNLCSSIAENPGHRSIEGYRCITSYKKMNTTWPRVISRISPGGCVERWNNNYLSERDNLLKR